MIEGRPVIRECGSYSIQSVGHGGAVWLFSPPMQPTVGDAKRTNLQIDVVKVSIRGGRPSKLCKLHLKAPGGSFAKLTRNINGDHGDIGRGGAALFTGRHHSTDRNANISPPQDSHRGQLELANLSPPLPIGPQTQSLTQILARARGYIEGDLK